MPNLLLVLSIVLLPPIPGAKEINSFLAPLSQYSAGHRGIDYLAPVNSGVYASSDGVITHAGLIANRWTISITNDSIKTTYEPVKPIVSLGSKIKAGELIGYLQLAGSHCLPKACLHFGVKSETLYFNPNNFIKRKFPRLLPIYS